MALAAFALLVLWFSAKSETITLDVSGSIRLTTYNHLRSGSGCLSRRAGSDSFCVGRRRRGSRTGNCRRPWFCTRLHRARPSSSNLCETADARAKAKQARSLAAKLTKRERQHVEIIASAIEGQSAAALNGAEQHLAEFPRDALVFSLLLGAFGLYAFSGRADHDAARLAICERYAKHYGEDWWFLTYLGWSHTEAGNPGVGRSITESALSLRRHNGNAAHALAHAFFEQGDEMAGEAFLSDWLPAYDHESFLNGHLFWHLALLALEADDVDGALKIYQEHISPKISRAPPLNLFTDFSIVALATWTHQ